jgi:hypothetical protein
MSDEYALTGRSYVNVFTALYFVLGGIHIMYSTVYQKLRQRVRVVTKRSPPKP